MDNKSPTTTPEEIEIVDVEGPKNKNGRKRKFRPAFSQPPKLFKDSPCASNFEMVDNSEEFLKLLEEEKEGDNLVVLMGTSKSVEACDQMKGIVNEMAKNNFPDVVFVEADVDKNQDLTKTQKLEMIPAFIIYKGCKAVDRIDGAHPEKLKISLCKLTGQNVLNNVDKDEEKDIIQYINLKKSECLNCSEDTSFEDFIARKGKLMSDCDEELILCYGFNQEMMLHSFKINAPRDTGPKSIIVFINQLKSLDFDDAKSLSSTQQFTLTKEDLQGTKMLDFDRWKFKKISNIIFYIPQNQTETDMTAIDSLTLYGEPVDKKKGVGGHTTQVVTLD